MVDFIETFSPVAKLVTVKVLFAWSVRHNWHLAQLDVNNVFLNRDLLKEVYMDLPLGYISKGEKLSLTGKLVSSFINTYGLKQASR